MTDLDHIAIAVKDLESSIELYKTLLGRASADGLEEVLLVAALALTCNKVKAVIG